MPSRWDKAPFLSGENVSWTSAQLLNSSRLGNDCVLTITDIDYSFWPCVKNGRVWVFIHLQANLPKFIETQGSWFRNEEQFLLRAEYQISIYVERERLNLRNLKILLSLLYWASKDTCCLQERDVISIFKSYLLGRLPWKGSLDQSWCLCLHM